VTSGPSGYALLDDVVDEAIGRGGRRDPVLPRSGGPAGNARLTAWTGVLLLAVIIAELVTLLDVTGLIGWHVGIGIVMVALTLMKSASTGWRIVRYYTGQTAYVRAGPPPTLLRLLGPLVVFTTLGVLGSGIALIAIGAEQSQRSLFSLLGQNVSPITIHQVFFVLFAGFTGLHLVARFVPALFLMSGRTQYVTPTGRVPGGRGRAATLTAALLASALAVALVLPVHGWHHDDYRFRQAHQHSVR
jgi:hypothetical protein